MDFIKDMYKEGLVDSQIDESAWADIRGRRIQRLSKEKQVALYAYLVGLENAMRATKFVEMAEQGKTPPNQYVKGYAPIVEMVDDIVNGGTAYISQLRQLHKRAKNSRK
jgi:hypothetical protein|tara:strand:+ start:1988 stop:2314 length:327 start_codon:yes stop_codon:yes gene_type:complete